MRLKVNPGEKILRIEPEALQGIRTEGWPKGIFFARLPHGWIAADSRGKQVHSYTHTSFKHLLAWMLQLPAPADPTPEEREEARRRAEAEAERALAERAKWKTLVCVRTIWGHGGDEPEDRAVWSREAERLVSEWVRQGLGSDVIAARFGIRQDQVENKKKSMQRRLGGI